jgi:peptidoglycan/xylan/chitin deacetylase (PgdA/CDA1 family)
LASFKRNKGQHVFVRAAFKWVFHTFRINELMVRLQRQKLLAVCYHEVLPERSLRRGFGTCVEQVAFRAQLRWLRQNLEVTDLSGLERWHRGEWTSPKGPVLITFDDGFRNNLTVAAPILKEEGCSALFFLATGYIGTRRLLWNHEVYLRVVKWPEKTIRLPEGMLVPVPAQSESRGGLAWRINQACKRLEDDQRLEYLDYLRSKGPFASEDDHRSAAFMDWNDARTLVQLGFEVGSHTVEHPILSSIRDRARLSAELRRSKETLERELQKPCVAIAYPNGTAQDVNSDLFDEVRAAGYRWAFMTIPVWQTPGGDPYQLARIGVPGYADMPTFSLYASGLRSRLSGAG